MCNQHSSRISRAKIGGHKAIMARPSCAQWLVLHALALACTMATAAFADEAANEQHGSGSPSAEKEVVSSDDDGVSDGVYVGVVGAGLFCVGVTLFCAYANKDNNPPNNRQDSSIKYGDFMIEHSGQR